MQSLLLLRRINTEYIKTTLRPFFFPISKAGDNLTRLFLYLVVDVLSIHIIIHILFFLQKVSRGWNPVIIQQLASILSHLVRLTFASLFEAFYMTVIRFRQRIILKLCPCIARFLIPVLLILPLLCSHFLGQSAANFKLPISKNIEIRKK